MLDKNQTVDCTEAGVAAREIVGKLLIEPTRSHQNRVDGSNAVHCDESQGTAHAIPDDQRADNDCRSDCDAHCDRDQKSAKMH